MNILHTATLEASSVIAPASDNSLMLIAIGFMFVLTALALLAAIASLVGLFFTKRAAEEAKQEAELARKTLQDYTSREPPPKPTPVAAVVKAAEPPPSIEDDPVLLAVISAAIHSVIGDKAHRIVSVQRRDAGWAEEGRRQIFSSHRLR